MTDIAVSVDHVSKTFKLPHEKTTSIKSAVVNFYRKNRTFEKQHVLKDISFEVRQGEFFGIVGRNGSGKSTLLKLLAGIYTPDKGFTAVNGKLTPFIELGVGFNPELTGRENVFLNGALLGFSRKEMEAMYDDIVTFAELERFMDQKLKNYSSGMQVRLAFSIAIRAKSDILVLDEVLAVGDEAFQRKCIDVFENYKSMKQTVILVTHDMSIVNRFCSRALLLEKGKILTINSPSKVANTYTQLNETSISEDMDKLNSVREQQNKARVTLLTHNIVKYGQKAVLKIEWPQLVNNVQNVGVAIYKNSGEYIFGSNTILDKVEISKTKDVTYSLDLSLGNGNYHYKVGLFGKTDKDIIEFINDGPSFTVKSPDAAWEGITHLTHEWRV